MNFSEVKKNLNYESAIRIGEILKPHANKGQLSSKIFVDIDLMNVESIFVEINKYLVPFFIDYSKSNFDIYPQILKLQNINSIEEAKKISNLELFLPQNFSSEIENNINDFGNFVISFGIKNKDTDKFIGHIISFNEDSKNPILEIETDAQSTSILLPLNSIKGIELDILGKELKCSFPAELAQI